MSARRASIKDVAIRAGVSVGTVSNVLNRPESVSPQTRLRVLRAIKELHFHRNASARQLRAGVSNTVGAVVLDVGNPFYTEMVRGIEDRLAADDHTLILCSSDGNPQREARFLRLLAEQGVRGVLITPIDTTEQRLKELNQQGIATVLLDADSHHQPSVGVDNVAGGRIAVTHLLERGHRRIAVLSGPRDLQQSTQRSQGAVEAVERFGLAAKDVLQIVNLEAASTAEGQRGMALLLDQPRQRPTAVFTINDIVALGVLRELRRRGVGVPTELAVVGYDDLVLNADLSTPLTSVRQPMRQLGWSAADSLLTGNSYALFAPELIVRASSDHLIG